MKKIYQLKSNVTNYCSFIENYPKGQESIMGRSMGQNWQPFSHNSTPITLKLRKNGEGKKNYQFDISGALTPFFIISETALNKLEDILLSRGQILPVISDSKNKKFIGYYPTNPLSNCLDKDNSKYREAEHGIIVEKPVLIAKNITDEYLFSIKESISRVFVTDKFKQRVEEAGLLAFDFSWEIPTS
ncbi:MAG: hypothetical protein ACTH5S_01795 [Hafnia alvei]|uniref:hypothetical protein n=1 Tax=Hafnia alvei TaxID=569 RepID=UPI0010352010|nr:hypothetical protein [Hafnia alvei]KAA0264274.1 hypothetical protein ERL64_00200 [Hafnia alvei]TBL39466.1 hypothetical protein EYZ01_10705 [Hafnia alvei]